jgi:DNA repair protein RadC
LLQSFLAGADRENFVVLLLDTKNKVVGINTVSIGTLNSAVVHPREVFKPAILANAASIILAHNHPSGDPAPSKEDVAVSKKLMEAGRLLEIEVLDHIIVGDDCFLSMKQKGLI